MLKIWYALIFIVVLCLPFLVDLGIESDGFRGEE